MFYLVIILLDTVGLNKLFHMTLLWVGHIYNLDGVFLLLKIVDKPFLNIKYCMPIDLAEKISCGLTQQRVDHIARNDRHQDHHEVAFQ